MTDNTIKTVKLEGENYPMCLRDLTSPPKQLNYKGKFKTDDFSKCLAVVGSRRMTSYGRVVLDRFIPELVSNGITIVSGFMYGVDTYAHELAVKNNGKTIAILGNGLEVIYPIENKKLYKDIIHSGGAIVSEYENNTKPHLWTYPQRNRIVAALSLMGVLVIEAGENSGSLVTVKWARKLKRKVYAVPGPITSLSSQGTNYILKKKLAQLVDSPEDILQIEPKNTPNNQKQLTDPVEAKIYQTLKTESLSLDELSLATKLEISNLSSIVSILSLKGLVEEIGGKLFAK